MKITKTLVIFGHNDINKSMYSKAILEELKKHPKQEVTVHVLSNEYLDSKGHYLPINVKSEQEMLVENDRIVFVFPVQWYAVPSLLKRWQEDVILSGFAYGVGGDKLKGKEVFFIATSAGSAENYSDTGYNNYPIMDFFKPFEQTFRLCSMDVRMPMFYQGVYHEGRGLIVITENKTPEEIKKQQEANKVSLEKLAKEAYAYITQKDVPAWGIRQKDLQPKLV